MNDNNSFSSYDGYYCNNNFQFTDLTTPLDANSSNHYFSSITEGFQSPQPFLSTPSSSVLPPEPIQTPLHNLHSNNLLPFVQIHTTNAQPTNNNFGNIFRRQQNHAEIKSEEPIKSEQSDATAATSANAQQANPTNNNAPDCQPATGHVTPPRSASITQPQEPQTTPQKTTVVQKCSQCPFLCLQAETLEKHVTSSHLRTALELPDNQPKKITCPGCDNVFYARESLEVHLISDHLMFREEAKQLLPDQSEEQPRRSRIYLKNVEFLREPQRQQDSTTLSLGDQSFCNAFQNINNDTNLMNLISAASEENNLPSAENQTPLLLSQTQPEKQKISIKSVDVLREPALRFL